MKGLKLIAYTFQINIKDLFRSGKAHLDNLIEGESDLYVSDAVQKAFIELDELGTEAAAANCNYFFLFCQLSEFTNFVIHRIH